MLNFRNVLRVNILELFRVLKLCVRIRQVVIIVFVAFTATQVAGDKAHE